MIERIRYLPFLTREYLTISRFERWPKDKIKAYQLKALKKIIRKALQIPFYDELYRNAGVTAIEINTLEDLQRLPIIDKALCRERGYEEYFLEKKISHSLVTPTSGSTGNPFQIRIPDKLELTSPLRVIHIMKQFGWKPFDRGLEIWVGEMKSHKRLMRKLGLLTSVSIFETPENIKDNLEKEKPDYIFSSRTTIEALVEHLQKVNFNYRPKFLMSSASEVYEHQRKKIEKFFQARLINVYGLLEAPTLAYSCPECDKFHVFQTTAIAEVINPRLIDGYECGDLVVTNLANDMMPFIRYRTGDVVKIIPDTCTCGRTSQVIGDIMGRADEIIKLKDGRAFNYLHFWMRFKKPLLVDYIDKIEQYKIWFNQKTEEILFQFRLNDNTPLDEGIRIVEKIVSENFSDIDCRYEIVDNIPISKSGKFKIIEVIED
jgi:phenylacetate-CoA ligase